MLHTFLIFLSVTSAAAQIGIANSQQPAELVGRWLMEDTIPDASERCGTRSVSAELDITKKITARAYRGNMRIQEDFENCPGARNMTSGLTVRVRDNAVSIEFDEEGWREESMLLQGNTLRGSDESGNQTTWIRQADAGETESVVDVDALDAYLDSLIPDYAKALRAEFGAKMLQNLRRTGLTREESIEVATNTVNRMAECVLGMVRAEVIANAIPLETLQRDHSAVNMLEPSEVDYRKIPCVHDAASNAGVMIY